MKYATVSLPDGNYSETDETWILCSGQEFHILATALEDFCTKNKSRRAKKLLEEMDRVPYMLRSGEKR